MAFDSSQTWEPFQPRRGSGKYADDTRVASALLMERYYDNQERMTEAERCELGQHIQKAIKQEQGYARTHVARLGQRYWEGQHTMTPLDRLVLGRSINCVVADMKRR